MTSRPPFTTAERSPHVRTAHEVVRDAVDRGAVRHNKTELRIEGDVLGAIRFEVTDRSPRVEVRAEVLHQQPTDSSSLGVRIDRDWTEVYVALIRIVPSPR